MNGSWRMWWYPKHDTRNVLVVSFATLRNGLSKSWWIFNRLIFFSPSSSDQRGFLPSSIGLTARAEIPTNRKKKMAVRKGPLSVIIPSRRILGGTGCAKTTHNHRNNSTFTEKCESVSSRIYWTERRSNVWSVDDTISINRAKKIRREKKKLHQSYGLVAVDDPATRQHPRPRSRHISGVRIAVEDERVSNEREVDDVFSVSVALLLLWKEIGLRKRKMEIRRSNFLGCSIRTDKLHYNYTRILSHCLFSLPSGFYLIIIMQELKSRLRRTTHGLIAMEEWETVNGPWLLGSR